VTLLDSPVGDTSNAATEAVTNVMFRYLWKKLKIIFQISSVTPHVDTATVAVSDVSPYGLSRNAKYRNLYPLPLPVKVAQHHKAPSSFW
jgi:hypothetical protein